MAEVGSHSSRGAARRKKSGSVKFLFLNNGAGKVGDTGEVGLIITNTVRVIPYIEKTALELAFQEPGKKLLFNLWGSGYF